jgi:hypothetical protein
MDILNLKKNKHWVFAHFFNTEHDNLLELLRKKVLTGLVSGAVWKKTSSRFAPPFFNTEYDDNLEKLYKKALTGLVSGAVWKKTSSRFAS